MIHSNGIYYCIEQAPPSLLIEAAHHILSYSLLFLLLNIQCVSLFSFVLIKIFDAFLIHGESCQNWIIIWWLKIFFPIKILSHDTLLSSLFVFSCVSLFEEFCLSFFCAHYLFFLFYKGKLVVGEHNSASCMIKVFDEQGTLERTINNAHPSCIYRLKLLPNRQMASASQDKTIKIWSTSDWSLIRTYTQHSNWTGGLEYIREDTLASGSGDGTIQIWSISNGETLSTIKVDSGVWALQILPTGMLASGDHKGKIKFWKIDSGSLEQALNGHKDSVNDLALVNNDQILASSSDDKTVRLWDLKTGAVIRVLSDHTNSVYGLKAISSTLMASASWDRTIRIWNSTSGELVKTITGHTGSFLCSLDMLNEGVLVSGSRDRTINLWNVSSGQVKETIQAEMLINCLIVV